MKALALAASVYSRSGAHLANIKAHAPRKNERQTVSVALGDKHQRKNAYAASAYGRENINETSRQSAHRKISIWRHLNRVSCRRKTIKQSGVVAK
jgi:hypothetical protein